MKLMPVLAALPLLCAPCVFAADMMSVGYFNGGDIDKLDVRQPTPPDLAVTKSDRRLAQYP